MDGLSLDRFVVHSTCGAFSDCATRTPCPLEASKLEPSVGEWRVVLPPPPCLWLPCLWTGAGIMNTRHILVGGGGTRKASRTHSGWSPSLGQLCRKVLSLAGLEPDLCKIVHFKIALPKGVSEAPSQLGEIRARIHSAIKHATAEYNGWRYPR